MQSDLCAESLKVLNETLMRFQQIFKHVSAEIKASENEIKECDEYELSAYQR